MPVIETGPILPDLYRGVQAYRQGEQALQRGQQALEMGSRSLANYEGDRERAIRAQDQAYLKGEQALKAGKQRHEAGALAYDQAQRADDQQAEQLEWRELLGQTQGNPMAFDELWTNMKSNPEMARFQKYVPQGMNSEQFPAWYEQEIRGQSGTSAKAAQMPWQLFYDQSGRAHAFHRGTRESQPLGVQGPMKGGLNQSDINEILEKARRQARQDDRNGDIPAGHDLKSWTEQIALEQIKTINRLGGAGSPGGGPSGHQGGPQIQAPARPDSSTAIDWTRHINPNRLP